MSAWFRHINETGKVKMERKDLRCSLKGAAITARLVIRERAHAHHSSSVSADIVLVRAKLASLGRNTFKLLLSRSVSITNLHRQAVRAKFDALELLNHSVTNITRLESTDTLARNRQI